MNVALETKVWGAARHAFESAFCAVSVLYTEAGGYCSRHLHRDRVNRFLVVSGAIDVVRYEPGGRVESSRERLHAGDVADVPAGELHRFEVIESGIVVEVYWPAATVRQDDIVRVDTGGKRA